MARYMIAPLDLTIEELNIYQLIYKKADFNSWVSDYTLDQLSIDSHQSLNISKKVASRIVNKLIALNYISVERVGVKGKATLYKINRECVWNESGTNRERIGNESVMNVEPVSTLAEQQRNESGANRERIGNESVTPIKDKDKKKENKKIFLSDSIEYRLCEILFNLMRVNNPKCKEPNMQTWCNHIDLMIRVDGRDEEEIKRVIKWCQNDSFWKCNILSTSKLREKYDALVLKLPKQERIEQPKQDIPCKPRETIYMTHNQE